MYKLTRLSLAVAGITILLLAAAAPALAHVTTDPGSAPKGGEITLGFRVPNEEDSATTTKFEVDFPADHPPLGVVPQAEPGWTDAVTNRTLNPPVQTDDGPVTQAVAQIVWSGGSIAPGHFYEFHVLVQQLPKDTDQVVFKAVQTYSNGDTVRWIDPALAGQPSPDHPTPVLVLTAGGAASAPTVDVSHLAKKSTVSTARTLAIIAMVVSGLGLVLAAIMVVRRPRT